MKLNDLDIASKEVHRNAKLKGFYDTSLLIEKLYKDLLITDKQYKLLQAQLINSNLMLIVSELSEMTEELRRGDYNKLKEELADVFIRLLDLTGYLHYAELIDTDIQRAILNKIEKNKKRPHLHNKLF